jgi:F0F1-type ATP synthase assembly protein I
MTKNEQDDGEDIGNTSKSYAKYTGIVFQMIVIIGIFAFAGHYFDSKFKNTTPVITALSCLVGVCLSIFQIVKQLK